MAWFDYLQKSGFFDPAKNPPPKRSERGVSMPHWDALNYLEKLAENFVMGKELQYVPEVVEIIRNISNYPVDNYITWFRLVNILANIPNDNVPLDVLKFMPIWVTSNYDTSITTSALVEKILPKFIGPNANSEDMIKGNLVFQNLFELRWKDELPNGISPDTHSYFSPYDLYNLKHGLVNSATMEILTQALSVEQFSILPDSLNYMLRDRKVIVELSSAEQAYTLNLEPKGKQLTVSLSRGIADGAEIVFNDEINDYFDRIGELEERYFTDIFTTQTFAPASIQNAKNKISFFLHNDFQSHLGFQPISDLEDESEFGNVTMHTFALIYRDWLKRLAFDQPQKAAEALDILINSQRYQLPYFKRLAIYVITQNWTALKHLFWKLAGEQDAVKLFSADVYKVELYELLKHVSPVLDDDDIGRLKDIFASGPMGGKHDTADKAAWVLRWYDALQHRTEFSVSYEETKAGFSKIKEFSDDGRVRIRIGHVSPVSADELLKMPIDDIVEKLLTFRTIDGWDDPTVEGLGDSLGSAVEEEPQKFTTELDKFKDINYYYAYQLCYGLDKARRKGKDFDWHRVMQFCLGYITSSSFLDGSLFSEDEPRASKEWVYGAFGNLISDGIKDDTPGFDSECLILAESSVIVMTNRLEKSDMSRHSGNIDYVTYSLNSTQGKVLRALLDVSLKDGRIQVDSAQKVKWKSSLKQSFCSTLNAGIIDGFILEGMYLQQFMFLDDQWLRAEIEANQKRELPEWSAFMGGLAFGKPISGDYYAIMHPHYERAVTTRHIDTTHQSGLLRHFLAFYFWDYESAFEDSLLYRVLIDANIEILTKLVQIVLQQKPHLKTLDTEDYRMLSRKIIRIWRGVLDRFRIIGRNKDEDLQHLSSFIDFIKSEELNENTTGLILETISLTKDRGSYFLFKDLVKLSSSPSAAQYIAKILSALNINYIHKREPLDEVIEYLYKNGEANSANEIVNRLTLKGLDFFRPLYNKYNP